MKYRFILCLSALLALSSVNVQKINAEAIQIKQFLVIDGTPNALDVYLYPGQGLTLDYGKTSQVVETLFLDNKRFVALDTDGCLNGLNGSSCSKNQATMLHLKLIDSLPGSSEVDRINKSLLTVVTVDANNIRRTYLYRIRPSYRTSDGDGTELIEYIDRQTQSTSKYMSDNIEFQLNKGISEGWLIDPQLIQRVRVFADLRSKGVLLEDAARQAQISMKFVNGLVSK